MENRDPLVEWKVGIKTLRPKRDDGKHASQKFEKRKHEHTI